MLLRLSTLATGHTGVRPETASAYAAMLDAGLTPVVREYGSLGCSGDLAPLAHCALALMGEGEVRDATGALVRRGPRRAHARPRRRAWPSSTGPTACSACSRWRCTTWTILLDTADVAAAMSVESLLGTDAVFAADLQGLRPHPGQAASAANIRAALHGSGIMASHQTPECTRVQDAYSLRCAPQVHGAARDTVEHARTVAERELAAAIDNPVITDDGRVESNGNFHGAPVGYVLDFLAIAVADVASMSERRTDRFLDVARSHGLPAVPRARPRRRLRPDDRAVHGRRAGLGAQAAGGPGERRLDPVVGHAGGPRVDGLARGPQAAPRHRRPDPGARHRDPHRRPRDGPARPAARRRRSRVPSETCCARAASPAPARTRTSPPTSRPRPTPSATGQSPPHC